MSVEHTDVADDEPRMEGAMEDSKDRNQGIVSDSINPEKLEIEQNLDGVEEVNYDRWYQSDTTNGTDEEVNNDNSDQATRYTNEAQDTDDDNSEKPASDLDLECLDHNILDMLNWSVWITTHWTW